MQLLTGALALVTCAYMVNTTVLATFSLYLDRLAARGISARRVAFRTSSLAVLLRLCCLPLLNPRQEASSLSSYISSTLAGLTHFFAVNVPPRPLAPPEGIGAQTYPLT